MNTNLAKCCFVVPLRIGVLIIGYLQLVIACAMIIISVIKNINLDEVEKEYKGQITQDTMFELVEGGSTVTIRTAHALLFTNMAFGVLFGVYSLLAIVGAHARKAILLRIYFWTSIVCCFVTVAFTIAAMVMVSPCLTYVIQNVLALVFTIYCLVVVRSAFIEIEQEGSNVVPIWQRGPAPREFHVVKKLPA